MVEPVTAAVLNPLVLLADGCVVAPNPNTFPPPIAVLVVWGAADVPPNMALEEFSNGFGGFDTPKLGALPPNAGAEPDLVMPPWNVAVGCVAAPNTGVALGCVLATPKAGEAVPVFVVTPPKLNGVPPGAGAAVPKEAAVVVIFEAPKLKVDAAVVV